MVSLLNKDSIGGTLYLKHIQVFDIINSSI